MKEINEINDEINKWITENQESLPINIEFWDVNVFLKELDDNSIKLLEFGKYNSKDVTTQSFYKPLTRLIRLK